MINIEEGKFFTSVGQRKGQRKVYFESPLVTNEQIMFIYLFILIKFNFHIVYVVLVWLPLCYSTRGEHKVLPHGM